MLILPTLHPPSCAEHHQSLELEDKMRLLMCYLATHPETMDDTKREQWAKLAGLSPQEMEAVNNLAYLGVQVMKQTGERGRGGGETWRK